MKERSRQATRYDSASGVPDRPCGCVGGFARLWALATAKRMTSSWRAGGDGQKNSARRQKEGGNWGWAVRALGLGAGGAYLGEGSV